MIRPPALSFLVGLVFIVVCPAEQSPNLIFIMADDLGYGDLGCFGQEKIKTPALDRLAAEGMKLTDFYAGSTVCAPSRAVLMTGQHTGRTWVRGNSREPGVQDLRDEDVTVAEVFKKAGYVTAMCGKWGLGDVGSAGEPSKQGFDYFYGYLNQHHAHNYYPTFLIENGQRVPLRNTPENEGEFGQGWAKGKFDYTHDLIVAKSMEWLEENHEKPFFLYLPYTIPHANNEANKALGDGQEVPNYGIYANEGWSNPDKGQAAMITRMDRDIGNLVTKLKTWGIAERTLVIFTSDNGHHKEGGNDPEFFNANGPLRGMKRDLTDGGIRVPTIAWWPGRIAAGSESDHVAYHGDLMAVACELTQQPLPEQETQSISFLPALLGEGTQKKHRYLYWEFYERGGKQAVRFDNWKAIRQPMFSGNVELYDLKNDIGEEQDLASEKPDLVRKAKVMMNEAHVPHENWKVRGAPAKKPSA
ncbi:MAG: arylsulfatase [Verrucomicrobiota bacterium]